MVGSGGGVLFVPILLSVFNMDPKLAIGTSTVCVLLLSASSTVGYLTSENVDWKISAVYNIGGIPGALLGAWMTTIVPGSILTLMCGLSLASISVVLALKKEKALKLKLGQKFPVKANSKAYFKDSIRIKDYSEEQKQQFENWRDECPLALNYKKILLSNVIETHTAHLQTNKTSDIWTNKNKIMFVFASFLGGLAGGLVGMGSGTITTSALVMIGVPFNLAAGSASLGIFVGSISGVATHAALGNVVWSYALILGISSLFGAFFGCKIATKMDGKVLKKMLGTIALFTAVRLFI